MNKTTTFEHGGKVYEVRAIPTLNGWKVRISSRAFRQMASLIQSTPKSIKMLPIDGVPEDLVAGLMETAERDFRRGVCTLSELMR